MDIRELRYFAAVYRERNLTAAAKRCFISQPSISAAITNLEAELGTTLFIRHKKGMAPTESAAQFHGIARKIIDDAVRLWRIQHDPEDVIRELTDDLRKLATNETEEIKLMETKGPSGKTMAQMMKEALQG